VGLIVGALVLTHWLMRERTVEDLIEHTNAPALAVAWGLAAFAIVIEQGNGNAFIYFQF
jgi:alginate O-acetyltransferase complex protein AlgI